MPSVRQFRPGRKTLLRFLAPDRLLREPEREVLALPRQPDIGRDQEGEHQRYANDVPLLGRHRVRAQAKPDRRRTPADRAIAREGRLRPAAAQESPRHEPPPDRAEGCGHQGDARVVAWRRVLIHLAAQRKQQRAQRANQLVDAIDHGGKARLRDRFRHLRQRFLAIPAPHVPAAKIDPLSAP